MKPIITRSLSGIVYVALIVFAIMTNEYVFAIVFAILSALTTYEFHKLTNKQEGVDVNMWLAMIGSIFLFVVFSFAIVLNLHFKLFSIPLILYITLLISTFIIEIFCKKPNSVNNTAYFLLGQIYIAVPFAVAILIFENKPIYLLALFVIIWANDTFAYLAGSAFGKHKMFVRISPKKSWEGFAGGALGTLLTGYVFSLFVSELNLLQWLGFALILVVFGTLGDLFESLIKRTIGVKDSGNIMPGHGGLLDRLDSVIFSVIPICIYLIVI
jgi:phosphatidate cytidylyltransferase